MPGTTLLRLSLTTPDWFLAETYQSILMMIRRCASDILEESCWRRWLSMFQQTSLSWKFGLHAGNIVLMILIVTQLKISLLTFIGRRNFEIFFIQYYWHMLIGWLLCWRLYLPHHILVELWALLRWALTWIRCLFKSHSLYTLVNLSFWVLYEVCVIQVSYCIGIKR